jgi:hypothetical protein
MMAVSRVPAKRTPESAASDESRGRRQRRETSIQSHEPCFSVLLKRHAVLTVRYLGYILGILGILRILYIFRILRILRVGRNYEASSLGMSGKDSTSRDLRPTSTPRGMTQLSEGAAVPIVNVNINNIHHHELQQ